MKSLFAFASMLVVAAAFAGGCSKKEKTESTETISTPGGETTVTETKEVEKTGDHK